MKQYRQMGCMSKDTKHSRAYAAWSVAVSAWYTRMFAPDRFNSEIQALWWIFIWILRRIIQRKNPLILILFREYHVKLTVTIITSESPRPLLTHGYCISESASIFDALFHHVVNNNSKVVSTITVIMLIIFMDLEMEVFPRKYVPYH
jgi:hypothetical protein